MKADVVKTTGLRNIDFFRLADFKRFKDHWLEGIGIEVEDAFAWMHEQHGPEYIYTISASYVYYLRNCEGDLIRKEERSDKRVDRATMEELLRGRTTYDPDLTYFSDTEFSVAKIPLVPSTSPNKMGENWWWEEKDAQAVIDDVLKKFGGKEQQPE